MESKYKFKITPACASDLDGIFQYISETVSEPLAAMQLMEDIHHAFRKVCDFPELYPLSYDENLKRKGYRKLVIRNYIALYLIDEKKKTIIFSRTFYGGRDYAKLI